MCVRVLLAASKTLPTFDADERLITIPSDCPSAVAPVIVRAILSELLVEQPQSGAVCWCGDGVDIPSRVPHQRRSEQVVTHGA